MTTDNKTDPKTWSVYYDVMLDKHVDFSNYIEDFTPYAKKIDVIVNRFLSYKFDKPGKENQSFKEFLDWFIEAEKKVLNPENFNSKEHQLRYQLLRYLFAVKLALNYSCFNPMTMVYRNFKSKKVKTIFGKLIDIGKDTNDIKKEELEDSILFVTSLYWEMMYGRIISGYGKLTPEGIKSSIEEEEFLNQQFKVKLSHISDIQPVLEFILGIDEVFYSMSPEAYKKCYGLGNYRSYRSIFLPMYVKYRLKKFGCNDRNFQFMRELFRS